VSGEGRRPHRVEQLAAGQEDYAGAAQGHEQAQVPRILLQIMLAPLHGADGDRVSHEECLETGFDGEESGEAFEHDYG
jgi:hypothetical protein